MRPGDATYDLSEERVNVSYSALPCTKGWPYGWNVPPGTVIGIRVSPKRRMKLSDLHLDLTKFTRFNNPHLHGQVHYNNFQEGFSIRVDDEDVVAFEYFPAASDRHLMCPEAAEKERETGSAENASPLFLYYLDVSSEEEKAQLELVANELKHRPSGSSVYIIGYARREACANEAINRARWAKEYLVELGVSSDRIITIDGGHKEVVKNEIYIVEPGQPRPLAYPDIYPGDVHLLTNCPKERTR